MSEQRKLKFIAISCIDERVLYEPKRNEDGNSFDRCRRKTIASYLCNVWPAQFIQFDRVVIYSLPVN